MPGEWGVQGTDTYSDPRGSPGGLPGREGLEE